MSIIEEDKENNQSNKNKKTGMGFGYISPDQEYKKEEIVDTQIFNVGNVGYEGNTEHVRKINHTNNYRFNNKKRLEYHKSNNKNNFNNHIEKITFLGDIGNEVVSTSANDSVLLYQSNKNASELEKRLGQTIINNPYDEEIFERFEDCFVSDGVAQKTLIRKYSLINGHQYTFNLALEYESEDEKKDRKNLKTVNDFKEYKNALNEIRYRLEKADFYNYDFKASVLKSVFGRAVLEKIHNTLDYGIINFNLLYNQALGDPIIDETNQLIGVEYEYTKKAQKENNYNYNSSTEGNKAKIIDIDKLIYYLNEDIPVSLGSSYFGLSEFESIVDASEGKKMILQTQSKEAIQTSYRGTGVFRTTEPMPDSKLTELAVKINEHRGNSFVMDQSIVGGFENTASNPEKMMIFLNEFNLEIIRGLNSMQSLGGYENAQNFATLDKYSTIYLKSVIIPKQNEHKRFIKKMLLDEMFTISLLRQGYAILLDKQDYIKKLYKVTLKPLVDVVNTNENEDGINVKVSMKPGYAIKDQYKEILKIQNDKIEKEESEIFTFTKTDIPTACIELNLEIPDFIEIQEYFKMILDLYKNKLATVKKVLQSVNMEDQIEEIEQLQQEAKEEEERRFSMQLLVNDSGNNDNDRPKQEKQNKLLTQKADNNKNKKKTLAK